MGDDTRPVKPISRRLRFEILRRDNFTCRYCGASAPDAPLTVDHVVPKALGGTDEPSNLVTACRDCNSGKGSTSPDEQTVTDVDDLALRWAAAMERAADTQREHREARDGVLDDFYLRWVDLYGYVKNDYLPSDWAGSIVSFLDRGLTVGDLLDLAATPMHRGIPRAYAFKYFAGACWNTLRDRAAIARGLIENENGD